MGAERVATKYTFTDDGISARQNTGGTNTLSLSPVGKGGARRSSSRGFGDSHKTWSPGSVRMSQTGVILFNTKRGESTDGATGTDGDAGR